MSVSLGFVSRFAIFKIPFMRHVNKVKQHLEFVQSRPFCDSYCKLPLISGKNVTADHLYLIYSNSCKGQQKIDSLVNSENRNWSFMSFTSQKFVHRFFILITIFHCISWKVSLKIPGQVFLSDVFLGIKTWWSTWKKRSVLVLTHTDALGLGPKKSSSFLIN